MLAACPESLRSEGKPCELYMRSSPASSSSLEVVEVKFRILKKQSFELRPSFQLRPKFLTHSASLRSFLPSASAEVGSAGDAAAGHEHAFRAHRVRQASAYLRGGGGGKQMYPSPFGVFGLRALLGCLGS